ncbi:hypothetical protein IAQ61_006494 [Plenodomus lingam]|uniref:uncharacterized protein n=1 Tax=Leptosphaeria maculans TaxID=5022 RepID=UPI003326F038|nr:hypothetical protein IAQ61_006494 [Plenodomus lingam]
MRIIIIGLVGLVGLVSSTPSLYTPGPVASNAYLGSALATAGDIVVCQDTLDARACNTIHAQGTCATLPTSVSHKVRNIYQAKGSVCKYFDKDCSAHEPVVSINSNDRSLWLNLAPGIGDRIGLVLCRNDWPKADSPGGNRGDPFCYWEGTKNKYICKEYPGCHLNHDKSEYICPGITSPDPQASNDTIVAQNPGCHFNVKNEYVCAKETSANDSDDSQHDPTSVRLCNKQDCLNVDAKTSPVLPNQYFHQTQYLIQHKGSVCWFYEKDCSVTESPIFGQVARDSDLKLYGPAVALFGAIRCESLTRERRHRQRSVMESRRVTSAPEPLAITATPSDASASSVSPPGNPTTIKFCNVQGSGSACVWLPAPDKCTLFPEDWVLKALTVHQEKGSICKYYLDDCNGLVMHEFATRDTGFTFGGPGLIAWGAVSCSVL